MQFDVSGFAELRLTFACQNGSQKRVCREKYFQENRRPWRGLMPKGQQRAASKLAG
jgi:hypothetical protein